MACASWESVTTPHGKEQPALVRTRRIPPDNSLWKPQGQDSTTALFRAANRAPATGDKQSGCAPPSVPFRLAEKAAVTMVIDIALPGIRRRTPNVKLIRGAFGAGATDQLCWPCVG